MSTFSPLWRSARDEQTPIAERSPLWSRLAVALAFTVLFTAAQVRHSLEVGRLAVVPQYDDIVYHMQAIARLESLRHGGVLGLLIDLRDHPLWSPWCGLLSTFAYAICGVQPWALYAANGVLVFAMLWLIDRLTVGATLRVRIACWVFILSTAIAAHAVTEFRPDIACAIATAAAVFAVLRLDANRGGYRAAVIAGGCVAAALLVKPTVFAATTVFIGTAGILMVARELVRCRVREDASIRSLVGKVAVCAGVGVGLAAPHYVWQAIRAAQTGGQSYFQYFYLNIFGADKQIWDKGLRGLDNIAYFIDGPAGQLMFGRGVALIFGIAALGTVSAIVRRRRTLSVFMLQAWAVAAVCLLMPASNPVKNPHFGDVFGMITVMIAAVGLRHLLTPLSRPAGPVLRYAALAVPLAMLVGTASVADFARATPGSLNPTSRPGFDPEPVEAMLDRVVDAMIEARRVAEDARRADGQRGPFIVFFPTSGYINKDTTAYLIARKGHGLWSISHAHKVADPVRHAELTAAASVVVVYEPGTADASGMPIAHEVFPSTPIAGLTASMAAHDGGLTLIDRVPSPAGPAVCVYARTGPSNINPADYAQPRPTDGDQTDASGG